MQKKIVAAIRAGNYAHVAAQYAGIGERTFYRWMERGEAAASGQYRQFRDAVKVAESARAAEAAGVACRSRMSTPPSFLPDRRRPGPEEQEVYEALAVLSHGERLEVLRDIRPPHSVKLAGASVIAQG